MFQLKQLIDTDNKSVRFRREPLAPSISEWRPGDSCTVSTSHADIKAQKERIAREFETSLERSPFDIQRYNQIDQGSEGACTLVSLFNLVHINNLDSVHGNKSWSDICKDSYWRQKVWLPIDAQSDVIQYYADMLDAGKQIPVIRTILTHPKFRYVPIRGDSQRELMTNAIFFTAAAKAATAARFGTTTALESPVTCGVGNFIESNLDAGNVIGLSFNGHARVAVAYNDTHVLFADSWGQSIDRDNANNELYVGGVSVVPKYGVYAYARDMVFFAVPKKPTLKKSAPKKSGPMLSGFQIGDKIRVTKGINKTETNEYEIITRVTKERVYFGTKFALKKDIKKYN